MTIQEITTIVNNALAFLGKKLKEVKDEIGDEIKNKTISDKEIAKKQEIILREIIKEREDSFSSLKNVIIQLNEKIGLLGEISSNDFSNLEKIQGENRNSLIEFVDEVKKQIDVFIKISEREELIKESQKGNLMLENLIKAVSKKKIEFPQLDELYNLKSILEQLDKLTPDKEIKSILIEIKNSLVKSLKGLPKDLVFKIDKKQLDELKKSLSVTVTGGKNLQYQEGEKDPSIVGTAMLWKDASDVLRAVSIGKPLPVSNMGQLVPKIYDYISLGYTVNDLTSVVYRSGGGTGTIVATLTLTYSAGNLVSVTRS